MATNTLYSIGVSLKLDAGTDSQGNPITVSTSMPTLNKTNYDDDKALAIIAALTPCLNRSIVEIRKTTITSVSAA